MDKRDLSAEDENVGDGDAIDRIADDKEDKDNKDNKFADDANAVQLVLGYLNFSSGATDPSFFDGLNRIFSGVAGTSNRSQDSTGNSRPLWRNATDYLVAKLDQLSTDSSTFANSDQARAVLTILPEVVEGYRSFHIDLLQHQSSDFLFNAFTYGRVCEAILAIGLGGEASESESRKKIVADVITKLNDYIGHRPVATLQARLHEPYPHEWVRPVPLYIQDVGSTEGPYREVIEMAMGILRTTDENLLRAAWFDMGELAELAVDPRAYDFEHPANKRPNYHFGQWDPHCIDNRGFYRRFVIRQVTLDALLSRQVDRQVDAPRDELLFEAAAVLAGTILMASGISGDSPDAHDSNTTLVSLIPRIATYRDAFYERLIEQVDGTHATRLAAEAARLHQPFGGARQHLNRYLAKKRARQLAHVKLARVFARMGYLEAAKKQAKQVPVTSARLMCRIDSSLTAGQQALDRQDLKVAGQELTAIRDLLDRGIRCGAIVDPWNILGFDANFSLFPALENSVHDHRIDELLVIVQRILELYSRFWSEASAADASGETTPIIRQFREFSDWWHQFAAHEVSSVDAVSAQASHNAASKVAEALLQWNQEGTPAGDVRFWSPHVETFDSPSAFGLVIETLMQKRDLVSSMSLLVYWLSQADHIRLDSAECSFYALTQRWLGMLIETLHREGEETSSSNKTDWALIRKFLDYLEANANEYWDVPEFSLASEDTSSDDEAESDDLEAEGDEDENLFSAAYENVVYTDSTDDGIDGSLFETGESTNNEIMAESERLVNRLSFLENLAHLWLRASLSYAAANRAGWQMELLEIHDTIQGWRTRAKELRQGLLDLGRVVENHKLPSPGHDYESLVEYDRQRFFRESLLENIMIASVALAESDQLMAATEMAMSEDLVTSFDEIEFDSMGEDGGLQRNATFILGCMLAGSPEMAREQIHALCNVMSEQEILYVPLAKGGRVRAITLARARQRLIENLVIWLPRHGLIQETRAILETTRLMERNSPVGPGAITQFDELFEAATRQIIETLVAAAERENGISGQELVDHVERHTEQLLGIWLEHSKTLRLSTLERVRKDDAWNELVKFVEKYGNDLFTQQFFALGNIRAILHAGVETWLDELGELPNPPRVVESLENAVTRRRSIENLNLILEAVAENYDEYRDYNSTTTQSDRGELLYSLLDFLRLRTAYDRVMWNLRPILFAHEILVRRGKNDAAQIWRRRLTQKIGEEADNYINRLSALQSKYAMRLSSVTDRLSERFLRPMTVDRMRALVEPALSYRADSRGEHAFELLEDESNLLMKEPAGSGLDVPSWLAALEEEVEHACRLGKLGVIDDVAWLVPRRNVTLDEIDDDEE